MNAIVAWYEMLVTTVPLPLLEVWGRFAYIVGLFLAICAFGGFHLPDRGALGYSAGRGRRGTRSRS
jgi:hypothetical protein